MIVAGLRRRFGRQQRYFASLPPAAGLASRGALPPFPRTPLYAADAPGHFIRFCISKQDAVLDAALERLPAYADKEAKTIA
jgi:hypothetical protein